MHTIGMRMAGLIEPTLVIEANHVDYQSVAVVPTRCVAHPGRFQARRMSSLRVDSNDSPRVIIALKEEDHAVGSLDHLKGVWVEHIARNSDRQTLRFRIVFRH